MATLWERMDDYKVIVDQSTEWTTYIGMAKYPRPQYLVEDQWYKSSADTWEEMWKIKRITEDDGIIEVAYPNGDTSASFEWDERTSYTYK